MPDGLDQYLDQFVPRDPKVDSILDRMRDSVVTQESGGNPRVKNARTSATGLFQVMPANIPTWTKTHYGKSLTPEQFASDVNAQEKVFRGEMGKYVNKALQKSKGDEDVATRMAAAAWYGGEGAMHRYDDPVKFRPNEPSFREYTTSILGRIKKGQARSQGLDKYLDQFTSQSNEGLDSYLDQFVDTPATQSPIDNYGAPAMEAQQQLESITNDPQDVVAKRLADYEALQDVQPISERFPGSGRPETILGKPQGVKQAQKHRIAPQRPFGSGVEVSVDSLSPELTPEMQEEQRKAEAQKFFTTEPRVEVKTPKDALEQGNAGTVAVEFGDLPEGGDFGHHIARKALMQIAPEYGLSAQDIDNYLKVTPNVITTAPPTPEQIEVSRRQGKTQTNYSVPLGQINDILNLKRGTKGVQPEVQYQIDRMTAESPEGIAYAGQEGRERDAEARLKAPRTAPVSFTDVEDWKLAFNKVFDPEFWKSGDATISQEERNRAVNESMDDLIRTSGSAREVERLQKEYEDMSALEKGVRHTGDIAKTILRFPASFAKTAAWAEDAIGYLREKGINLPTLTTTDIYNAADWLWSKTLGVESQQAKQGDMPMLLAKAIEKGIPDDPKTANTLLGKISRGAGSAIPFMIGAVASGGSTAATILMGIGAEAGELYTAAKDKGLDREKTLLAGLTGVPLGASEALGLKWAKLGQLINDSSKGVFVKSITNWLKETGKELTEESLQEYFQSAAGKITIDALKNNGLTREQVADAMGESMGDAAIGGLAGAIFGGGVPLATGNVKIRGNVEQSGEVKPVNEEPVAEVFVPETKQGEILKEKPVRNTPVKSVEPLTVPPETEKVSKAAPKAEKPVEDTQEIARDLLNKYESGEGVKTVPDIVDAIEELGVPEMDRAVGRYRREQRDDFEMKGRNDMDSADQEFIRELESFASPKTEKAFTPKTEKSVEATGDFTTALAELQKASSDNINAKVGKAVMLANGPEQMKQIKAATEARQAELKKPVEPPVGESKATPYSRESLKKAFNLTDAQAEATHVLAKNMGIDLSSLEVAKGGKAGEGALKQDNPQTKTPEFKKFFEGSKVVDDKGEPLVVYHGTADDIKSFREGGDFHVGHGQQLEGIYFSELPHTASAYARSAANAKNPATDFEGSNVVPAYLSLQNPKVFTRVDEFGKAKRASLEAQGYDGAIRRNIDGQIVEAVVFKPTQIKSAIGNRGTFDPKNPSILEQGAKGATEFAKDGKAIIRGFKDADFSTGVHEIAHVARRQLFDTNIPVEKRAGITDQDIKVAETWAGAKDGKWDRRSEEKFARGFERYLRDGKAPTADLKAVFAKFKDWLTNIYKTLKGSAIDVKVSPEMRKVFDKLVSETPEIKAPPESGFKGEKKLSKVGRSIETKAIEQNLATTFDGTAEFEGTTVKEQADKVSKLLEDPERITRILKGEEPLPDDIREGGFITTVENDAIARGDAQMLSDLAKSDITSETSRQAQSMRMLAERTPDSPVVQMRELAKAREEATQKRLGKKSLKEAKQQEVDKIKESVKQASSKRQGWGDFIKSITCGYN